MANSAVRQGDLLTRLEAVERLAAAQQRRLQILGERHNQLQDSHESLRECLLAHGSKLTNAPPHLKRKIKARADRRRHKLFRAVFQNRELALQLAMYVGVRSSIRISLTAKVPGTCFRKILPKLLKALPPQMCVLAGLTMSTERLAMVERFDALSETWSSLPPRPSFSFCCAAAPVNGCIYAFDGDTAVCLNAMTKNPQWEELPPLSASRYNFAAAAVDDMVYLCGGLDSSGETVATVVRYSTASRTWAALPPMPTARSSPAAAGCKGVLYVFGGADTTMQSLRAAEGYVAKMDGWAALDPMPTRRSSCGAGVVLGMVYVAGGHDGGTALSRVEQYHPRTGMWSSVASMPTPRCDVAVASARGALYVFGGSPAEHTQNSLRAVERFDTKKGTWTGITPMRTAGRYLSAMLLQE